MAETHELTVPPTQYLAMEVLAARFRLGLRTWTFPTSCSDALRRLEHRGWVWSKSGTIGGTRLAGLTDEGMAEWGLNVPDPTRHIAREGASDV